MRLPVELVGSLRSHYEGRAVCVTGGAGFIGGHLIDALTSLGASVTVIDDLSNATLDHLAELIELDPGRLRFIHGSILDMSALARAVDGCSVLFHLAAVGSVPRSIEDPIRTFSVNATGTVFALQAARAARVERFIFASSSSVYGGCESGPSPVAAPYTNGHPVPSAVPPLDDCAGDIIPRAEHMPPNPCSPYAASKLAAEACVRAWARSYDLPALSLRFFNVFGPRQAADSRYAAVVAAFAKRLIAGEAPVVFGDGEASRDFTYVANVVAANLLAGAAMPAQDMVGQPINVGTGRRVRISELAQVMAERAGVPHVRPDMARERAGDVKHSLADIAIARRALGYQPFATLEAGLEETIAWYRRLYAGA